LSEPAHAFRVGPGDQGKRLDRFLHERIPGLSRGRIQRAIRERVTLSWGVLARPATPVRPGGTVAIRWTPLSEVIRELVVPVHARGRGWLAVNKPPGVPVHPVNTVRENSIIRMLRRQEKNEDLRLCHRLDRETSGVLLVADNSDTARTLSEAFARGAVEKEYLAWVSGEVAAERGTVDLPIGSARGSRVWVRRDAVPEGQSARTDWVVELRLPGKTLVRVFPRTGRRHQIRVHLAAVGHPILGDLLYGRSDDDYLRMVSSGEDARANDGGPRRQMLHSARLEFPDPDGAHFRHRVEVPIPGDMANLVGAHRECLAGP
jgi:RluA family pseudouridine synthase